MKNKKGFTLIELLIVIGILAVLAITVLLALNPAEAQKKNRDLQRVKDLGTLQAIVDQYINDGQTPPLGTAIIYSNNNGASRSCTSAGWLGVNICGYAQQLPSDPNQGLTRKVATGGSIPASTAIMNYTVVHSNGTYKVCVHQESLSNNPKLLGDAGTATTSNLWVEAGSDLGLDCGTL